MNAAWSETVRLSEVRGTLRRRLSADAEARGRIAKLLKLDELPELEGQLEVAPWLDGAKIKGSWRARVVQTCGLTLEPFETPLQGEFEIKAVPADSPAAPAPAAADIELDLESEDPPDVLESEDIDLAGYLVEHLALEIDPYPRKPDAEWEPRPPEEEVSPFAVLQQLKVGKEE